MAERGRVAVEAAGAVLWREADEGLEVAVVHRPKYDDWSLPKGKLDPGEHPLLAAVREVREETGLWSVPGLPLGEVRYSTPAGPKRVRYWAARATNGTFAPSREVDELRWLRVPEASALLDADRDRSILDRFLADTAQTRATVVVRHASAGDRKAWDGDDRLRPLDERGRHQAEQLAGILTAYDVSVAAAADSRRCRDTLLPFANAAGIEVRREHRITSETYGADPDGGADAMYEIVSFGRPAVVCVQREVLSDLVARTCSRLGTPTAAVDIGQVPRASLVVLHVSAGNRLVAREWLEAPGQDGTPQQRG